MKHWTTFYKLGYLPEALFSLVILASQGPLEVPIRQNIKSYCDAEQDC